MLDLDSDLWDRLRHAYGFAGDVPGMLRRLAANPDEKAWEKIWSSLCHQSHVYSATYAAVPHVVEIARRQPLDKQVEFWVFVGIVGAHAPTLRDAIPEELQEDYFTSLKESASDIRRVLDTRPPRSETTHLLMALVAVLGSRAEARLLDYMTDDEVPGRCPSCSIDLEVSLDGDVVLLQTAKDSSKFSILPTPSGPISTKWAEPLDPKRVSEWLPSLAALAGHPVLATQIRALYTQASCPQCHQSFDLMGEFCRQAVELDLP